jgi:hypothetical protein
VARSDEGGLTAALARLEEVYMETDMDVSEYRRRKARITDQYLDNPIPSGGILARAAHGDRVALVRLGVYAVSALVLLILAAIILSAVFAGPTYLGGDD